MKNQATGIFLTSSMLASLFLVSCNKDKDSPSKATAIYFTVYDDNSVSKIDLRKSPNSFTGLFNGSDGITTPEGITLTKDGYLIITEEATSRILKLKKDGSGDILTLYDGLDGVDTPTAICVDNANGNLYWCNSGTGQVFRGSDDGSATPTPLYNGQVVLSYSYGLAIDKKNSKLYISDFDHYIQMGDLDGSGTPESVWTSENFISMISPSNIYVDTDNGKIYWCDENSNQVVEANMDGTGTPVVLFDDSDGVDRPDGVFVDNVARQIYWTETKSNVIARGNLDGTGDRVVLISHIKPYAIVME